MEKAEVLLQILGLVAFLWMGEYTVVSVFLAASELQVSILCITMRLSLVGFECSLGSRYWQVT